MPENPIGRPSKYKPEYCQLLIEHMSTGLSFESFAAVIKVNRDTLYAWEKDYPEFSDAKKEAFEQNLLFWEKHGIDGLYNTTEYDEKGKPTSSKSINSTVWIFNMKNRHKWGDKQVGEDDKKITHEGAIVVTSHDLADRIAQVKKGSESG